MCCLFFVFEGTDADIFFNENSESYELQEKNDLYQNEPLQCPVPVTGPGQPLTKGTLSTTGV